MLELADSRQLCEKVISKQFVNKEIAAKSDVTIVAAQHVTSSTLEEHAHTHPMPTLVHVQMLYAEPTTP
jgi:hypothetical protein